MKLIKLTNAAVDRIGHSVILNTDLIVSFFDHVQEDGTKVTAAYGMNNNAWEIQESIDEIMAQIRE